MAKPCGGDKLFFGAFAHYAQVNIAVGRASPRACEPNR
jgi:hypothetical protein